MTDLKELGILDSKSVKASSAEKSIRRSIASFYKIKPGTTTAPRLNTRIVKLPMENLSA